MSVTLTTDPIITEQLALDVLKWPSSDQIRLAINAVSARFLKYTNRARINKGTVVEYQRGRGLDYFWCHATPIDTTASMQFDILDDGVASETFTLTNRSIDAESGHVYLHGTTIPRSDGEKNLKAGYTGGWTTVPGDIQQSALMLMRLDKDRLEGLVGVTSAGREGQSASYETDDLPDAVRAVWERYRFLA